MPDTKRAKATLATLLADNVSGDISPQDVRDVLESMDVARGAYYWTAFATTTITLQGTAVAGGTNRVKLAGTTTSKTLNRFVHASPNKLTYTGLALPSIRVDIFAQFCFTLDTSVQDLIFEIYKNGVYLAGSFATRHIRTLGLNEQVVIFGEDVFTTTDFLEIMVANSTSAGTILTPLGGYINAQEIPIL